MNKTVTINLSGIVFHIEEEAYDKLGKYLNTIKGYFKASDGRDEIISDIESRIAELFQGNVTQFKQVITMKNVDDAILIMGKPEDFAGEENSTSNHEEKRETKNEKYESQEFYSSSKRKRVFRDSDNKVFGGVCSGIATYFDIDPLWIRLGFAFAFFGFGTGLLLYILLLIILPEAKTTAEKLEMRGEPVNVENIKKTVHEEMDHLKKKMNDLKNEFQSEKTQERLRKSTTRFTDFVQDVFGGILKVILKFFAITILIAAVVFLVILLASAFGVNAVNIAEGGITNSYSLNEIGDIFFSSMAQVELAILGALMLLGVPLLSMIYWCIRKIFDIKKNKFIKMSFTFIWLVGLGISTYLVFLVLSDFKTDYKQTSYEKIIQPKRNILYLEAIKDDYVEKEDYMDIDSENSREINISDKKMVFKKDNKLKIFALIDSSIVMGCPTLKIEESNTDSFELIIISSSRGNTKKVAQNKAQNISYKFTQTDSLLSFSRSYSSKKTDKWRLQHVKMILKIPRNKMIYLGKSMRHVIYDIDNVGSVLDDDMLDRRWIMTEKGLKCIDCKGLDLDSDEEGVTPTIMQIE